MVLQGDLHIKVFCLRKIITNVVDTVLQQYGLIIMCLHLIHSRNTDGLHDPNG